MMSEVTSELTASGITICSCVVIRIEFHFVCLIVNSFPF